MHESRAKRWKQLHSFNHSKINTERRTLIVVIITFAVMVAEIIFGLFTHSMALLADGWHMGTHAFALGISVAAYVVARKQSENSRFTFGTWKIEILGAYSSALILGLVSIAMIFASIRRLAHPLNILYDEAIIVAIFGLVVNIVCAFILNAGRPRNILGHTHHHDEGHDHADLNLKSAYLHVIADALTSVFAIAALLGAKYLHSNWMDPLMGIVGAILIARWAGFLLKDSAQILLDHGADPSLCSEINHCIESDGDSIVSDLHVWKVGYDKYACIISVDATKRYTCADYKDRLKGIHNLAHITLEINERKDQ
jgi:cation diffusion facilitator family transporter